MFTNILKYTTLQKVKISHSGVHQKLQDLLYQQSEGLSNKVMGLKRQVRKRKNRKEEFSKLDEFDLSVIRRIVHGYYARNENFSLKKLLNKLKDEIHFPYSVTTLSLVLKILGFKYKKRQRESIVHERADLVAWRESFMRRKQEIKKMSQTGKSSTRMKLGWMQATESRRNGLTKKHCKIPVVLLLIMEPLVARRIWWEEGSV